MVNPYGKIQKQNKSDSVSLQHQKMQSDLERNRALSETLKDLTGYQQIKSYRLALKMTSPQELSGQAAQSALQECVEQTVLGAHLRETGFLK